MNEILKKMQFKGENEILILNSPPEFEKTKIEISSITKIISDPKNNSKKFEFILIFVKSSTEIQKSIRIIKNNLSEDGILWFAYPKKSSKKYKSDVNRDNGWQPLGDLGFEGVRAVAIDDDWSALRFRDINFIKNLTRDKSRIMTQKGNSQKK